MNRLERRIEDLEVEAQPVGAVIQVNDQPLNDNQRELVARGVMLIRVKSGIERGDAEQLRCR